MQDQARGVVGTPTSDIAPAVRMAALNQANLSANYAGLVRQRDRDARDAAGAAATRNQ